MENSTTQLLGVKEAARRLGVSRRTMWRLLWPNGPVVPIRIGRRCLVSQKDLEDFVAACRRRAGRKTRTKK
jgi:excisionase family DNA binding protein